VEDRHYTPADLAYLSTNYSTLESLCDGRAESPTEVEELIEQGHLPGPSYVLDDGTGMFPYDYFRLQDEAGGVGHLRGHFYGRHRAACLEQGRALDAADDDWDAYLDGTWGVCLHEVTPETIVRKAALVSSLCELLMLPRPRSAEWQQLLREQINELDALERDFAPDYERADWNDRPPTRDLLTRFARHRYPAVFAEIPEGACGR
jgi:hypothetical protein